MTDPQKIFSLESLFRIAYDLKARGKRIGLTHGAFDLFHHSHLDLLRKSSKLCDFLIVGVDSDKSVSEYKSYKRPLISEEYRMQIINELSCVNAVFKKDIELDQQSHIDLYKELGVDIISFGQHFYAEDQMKERTSRAGAILVQIQTVQSITTTSIIEAIIRRYTKEDYREVPKTED